MMFNGLIIKKLKGRLNMLFRNISFRVKIFIIIFIAILIPTISVSTIIYKKSENAITAQTSRTITSSMNFVIGNIDSSLNAIMEISKSILTDERLSAVTDPKSYSSKGDRVKKYSEIRDLLDSFSNRINSTYMLDGIESYYFYILSQRTIINSKSTYFENVDEKEVDFLQKLNMNRSPDSWFVTVPFESNLLGFSKSRLSDGKLLTFAEIMTDAMGNRNAVLAINVDMNFINDSLNKIQAGMPGEIFAMDRNGTLVSRPDRNISSEKSAEYREINKRITDLKLKSGSFFQMQDMGSDFVIYSVSEHTDWRYVVIIPDEQVLGQVWEIQKFLITVISIAAVLVLILTYLLSCIFYNPLKKIALAMQQVGSRNLDVRIDDRRRDEYHMVFQGFNDMVTELKSLIRDLVNEKILKKEAEIKLLQAQINPHFLYNTLESIHSIAKIKKVDEISRMVSALSKFFRISLSGGKDMVTLEEAINLVLNYLTIQNIRFNGKIVYKIDVPGEFLECIVPKLILQPIVENSIYHGIEKKKGGGMLTVSARLQDGELQLWVEDDGVGICESDLKEIRKSIAKDDFEDSENFALRNLNRQLKLKYGPEYGVNIESVEKEGTKVCVRLPMLLE